MNMPIALKNRFNMQHILYVSLITILFTWCYASTIGWMYVRFSGADTYYSHGFLVPFVTGFFIWQKRNRLKEIPAEKSVIGLILILTALLFHILGTILYIFSISGFSIWILAFGISLFLWGPRITREILFPLLFLGFMFPMPEAIISLISFPLKLLVAQTGTDIVRALGIPILREGFNITIPAGTLLVGNPCSGLRSMIAFLALGAVYAYIFEGSNVKKMTIFLAAIPIAVLSNIVRVPILILTSHFYGLEAAAPETFWHTASGVLVFVIGLSCMFGLGKVLEWKK